jgi:transposase
MNKLIIPEGYEIRCELVRLYFEPEHPAILCQLQDEVRNVINHVVRSRKDVMGACKAYALKHGLVGEPPSFPDRPLLPTPKTSNDNKAVRLAWDHRQNKEAKTEYIKWLSGVLSAVKNVPECKWRNDSYQTIRKIYKRIGDSTLYRDTVNRIIRTKTTKRKKPGDWIPLIWGNAPNVIQTGEFYGNRRGTPFYNALIKIPGIKKKFLGRLRRPLPGKVIPCISLICKADGWYAVIKCIVPKRKLPEPTLGPIGVDVGQTDMVALSDGYSKHNPRDKVFKDQKAAIQKKGDLNKDANFQRDCRNRIARMDQNRNRKVMHWINAELLPKLENHSHVFVEKLAKDFKSDKGSLSCMHITLNAIKQRLGDLGKKGKLGPASRVKEVTPAYTSQTCSCCGNDTKIVREGKYFACLRPGCEAILDADVNAARNILSEGLKLLAA